MRLIDADKFLAYLIFSKHIDGLTCGEVKEAVEMCKVDVLDKITDEIDAQIDLHDTPFEIDDGMDASFCDGLNKAKEIIDKYGKEKE